MTEVHIRKNMGITTLFIACTRNRPRNRVHYISKITKYGNTVLRSLYVRARVSAALFYTLQGSA